MALDKYNKKRNFNQTSEPKGETVSAGADSLDTTSADTASSDNRHIFVVQRHAATRLHYDFRLEMEGVLKSWAVPKGPSLNPTDKRLAIMVEDHPYSYRTFEGTIPEGNYGAGEVEIWDEGTYEPLLRREGKTDEEILLEGLNKGSVKIILHGKKLKGEFALVKMHTAKEANAWLLIKHNDSYAVHENYDAENYTSSKSKITKLVGKKYKTSAPSGTASKKKRPPALSLSGQEKLSQYIRPMLAITGEDPFDSEEWIFEIKWDGYRAIADLTDGLQFYSRNGLSFLGRYPLIEAGLGQQTHQMIVDGEIVAYDKNDKPDFQTLQHFADNPQTPLIYHVFDLLFLNGYSTKELPLLQRKELLKEALTETSHVKFCDHVENKGKEFYKAIQQADLEGMIAKKKSSLYIEGVRTAEWVKIKNHQTDEAVIAGYTEPRGSRKYFGALILGKYREGKLYYAGHTGTGFSKKSLKEIHILLQPMVTEKIPFTTKPPTNAPPTWLKPETVCTVKYSRITEDGLFRQPVFIGIRDDLSAIDLYHDSLPGTTVQPQEGESAPASSAGTVDKMKYTHLDKLYWKKEKITKGELIDYYLSVSEYILPHLKNRAQSLHRFPDGIDGLSFYHKDAGKNAPSWVETVSVFSESNNKELEYIVCNNKETLGYLINLGCIELNPWNNRIENPGNPDYLIIDLDPSEKNSFIQVIEAAQVTKEILEICQVPAYCKTSGSTGIHIFVPMGAQYTYDQVRDFAHIVVRFVEQRLSGTTTLERSLRKRGPKIYLDYMQNREGQTVASAYSVRPKPGATVSMPVEWDELTKDLSIGDFSIHNALSRLARKGDIFLPVLEKGIDLKKAIDRLVM
ncbi:DNA ligase D [Proteiniphilum acetatigenes]|uniref:DNA ligase D n=1 Tax=Proteiniphilum acetatigenes TaxID=294710 RepID=UPI00036E92AD|nr:DNA ligase D [Proteiniphilum acetatigenes]SFK63696.1 bifunctional non-homologous end joining protein LigD [Porphyromonadaceae bacterium KH3CP3RA]